MKKTTIILFVIVFYVNTLFAQTIFEETFETGNTNLTAPTGWICDANGWVAGYGVQSHDQYPHSGDWYASFKYNSNKWMYKQVTLTANETYEFSMWYKTDGRTGFSYEVLWGTTATTDSMKYTIQSLNAVSNSTYQQLIKTFTPAVSGTFYIGIHGISDNNPWYLVVDDIKLRKVNNYNFEINKLSNDAIIFAGSSHDYKVKIKNIGTSSDIYDLNYTSNWNVSFYQNDGLTNITSLSLDSYATDSFIVRQFVPNSGVNFGQIELSNIKVSSQNSIVSDSIFFTSTAVTPINNFPITESFENSIFPTLGWLKSTNIGTYNFERVTEGEQPTCTPHDGSIGMVCYKSFMSGAGNSANLFSPPMLLDSNEYIVRFWMYRTANINNKQDKIEVYLSDDHNYTNSQLLGTIHRATNFTPTETTEGWFEYSFIFPGYAEKKFIVFKAVSDYGWNLYLDDISIKVNSADITAPELISVSKTNQYADLPIPLTVVIRDESRVKTAMEGIYNVGNGNHSITLNLNSKIKGNYTFTGEIPAQVNNTTGVIKFIMKDSLGNTAETYNFNISWNGVAPLLEESFENTFPPQNWIVLGEPLTYFYWMQASVENYDDSDGNSYIVTPPHGLKQAMVGWDFQENKQDEWLITPEIPITVPSDLSFETFAQLGSNYYDHYVVAVSTDGINWNSLWDAFMENNNVIQYDQRLQFSLDEYIGQTIRISWRAYNPSFQYIGYSWFLDDVKVEKRANVKINMVISNNEFDFRILKNPTHNELRILTKNDLTKLLNINIIDIYGNNIKEMSIESSSDKTSINISELKAGIYFCTIKNGKQSITKKFIKL